MRTKIVGFLLITIACFYTCREDFDFEQASQSLGFSSDTVSIDTVFSNFNSETFAFKIYNRQDEDLLIPRIYLGRGNDSFYKINVDGTPGTDFNNVPIRANDSIYVFVEMAIPETTTQQYEDDVFVETSSLQNVKLISWIEQATYYVPENNGEDVNITETVWDNSTVKVIQGNAILNNDLSINAGTKVYFFTDASLTVQPNTNLTVNGTLNEKVIFRGHGHTPRKDSLPGQWNKILLQENAGANFSYAKIIGGSTGIESEANANLQLINSEIYNNLDFGLDLYNANVTAENLIVNNSNQASVAIRSGGTYNFTHCTLANYFDLSAGNTLSAFLSNTNIDNIINPLNANFNNCILYGITSNAVFFDESTSTTFNYSFNNCVVRNTFPNENLNVSTDTNFTNTVIEDPMFVDFNFGVNNLRLQEESSAINMADPNFSTGIPQDFDGNSRIPNPDIGAFEFQN